MTSILSLMYGYFAKRTWMKWNSKDFDFSFLLIHLFVHCVKCREMCQSEMSVSLLWHFLGFNDESEQNVFSWKHCLVFELQHCVNVMDHTLICRWKNLRFIQHYWSGNLKCICNIRMWKAGILLQLSCSHTDLKLYPSRWYSF